MSGVITLLVLYAVVMTILWDKERRDHTRTLNVLIDKERDLTEKTSEIVTLKSEKVLLQTEINQLRDSNRKLRLANDDRTRMTFPLKEVSKTVSITNIKPDTKSYSVNNNESAKQTLTYDDLLDLTNQISVQPPLPPVDFSRSHYNHFNNSDDCSTSRSSHNSYSHSDDSCNRSYDSDSSSDSYSSSSCD